MEAEIRACLIMRHPKGIDLSANGVQLSVAYEHDPRDYKTLKDMPQYEVLGGKCSKCGRIAWLDKREVMQKVGNQYLLSLGRHLKCRCGNKDGNKVMIGTISRNA